MDWLSVVSTVGFPICACLGLAWYVKYITDKNTSQTENLNKLHTEEMLAYKDELKTAINNNTLVMQRLCDKLDAEQNLEERGERDEVRERGTN